MQGYTPSRVMNSPQSSDGVVTCADSPDTKLTVFSPQDMRFSTRFEYPFSNHKVLETFTQLVILPSRLSRCVRLIPCRGDVGDPFTTPGVRPRRIQLSPTASTFSPTESPYPVANPCCSQGKPAHSHVTRRLTFGSDDDVCQITGNHNGLYPQTCHSTDFGPIGERCLRTKQGTQSSIDHTNVGPDVENRTRCFAIEGILESLSRLAMARLFTVRPLIPSYASKTI
jgi:hypothetical protein